MNNKLFFILFFFLISLSKAPLYAAASEQALSCIKIENKLQRLTCFDKVFSTPIYGFKYNSDKPKSWLRAKNSELKRVSGDAPLLTFDDKSADVWITIPSNNIQGGRKSPLLVLSCITGISRVELVLNHSLNNGRVTVSLGNTEEELWRSDDSGLLLSAARGNAAVNHIKKMQLVDDLKITSSSALINGLQFSTSNLKTILNPVRERCNW